MENIMNMIGGALRSFPKKFTENMNKFKHADVGRMVQNYGMESEHFQKKGGDTMLYVLVFVFLICCCVLVCSAGMTSGWGLYAYDKTLFTWGEKKTDEKATE